MLNRKIAVSLTLIGLFAADVALALPGFTADAPQSSVDACVAAVASKADYSDATHVRYEIETEERRTSGHRMAIHTIVYGDGELVIREYAAKCAIDGDDEIRRFKIRQKGV